MAQAKYTAEEIEAVRKRPAMYIGGTGKDGYHHLLWEIVDNSIDEVINGHASKVVVTLHKGGKFDRGKSYAVSGGLHGVGASVVNALSSELVATVKRDGERYEMQFERGDPKGKLKKLGGARGNGTTVTFHPDEDIFGKLSFDAKLIADRLEAKSYLHGGLEILFADETQTPAVEHRFVHENGIAEYLPKLVAERGKPVVPPGAGLFYMAKE